MSFAFRVLLCLLALSFIRPILTQSQSSSSFPNSSPSSAEPALRAVVEKYFALYTGKDLDGLMSLWSEKSPDYASIKENLQRQFTTEDYSFGLPTISRVKVEREKASLRATVNLTAINLKSNQKSERKIARNFDFVREDGKWKVWRSVPAENDLAEALVKAKTEDERAGLLANEKDLVTAALVSTLSSRGDNFYDQADYSQALAIHLLAQNIAEQIGDQPGIALTLFHIGNVHWSQGNYAQASEYLHKSLTMNEALKDQKGIARALNSIGIVHWLQANYDQASEYFRKSLAILEVMGDKAGIASTLNNIGSVHDQQGDYGQALEYFHKSLAMTEALGDKAGIARAQHNIGIVYTEQGNYVQAMEYLQNGLALHEALGNKLGISRSRGSIGRVYYLQSNYAQAFEQFRKCLALSESIGDKKGLANALGNIGNIYLTQANYEQAIQYYRKSLELSETMGDKDGIAVNLDNIGSVYDSQGNYAQALDYHQKSLALREAMGGKEGIALAQKNIGNVHYHEGRYAQALEYFQKSLVIQEELGDKNAIAVSLSQIGKTHEKQGRHEQALEFVERAAALAREIGETEVVWKARLTAGAAHLALKQPAEARLAFEEAIATIETLRTNVAGGEEEQQRYFESKVSPYHAMVDLLVTRNNPAEALTFAERAKARVLLDVLQTGRGSLSKATTSQEQEQERKLNGQLVSFNTQISREATRPQPDRARLTQLKSQLQQARLDFEAFQNALYAAHPELRVQRGEARPLKLEEATVLLPDATTALLEYVVADDKTYLFAVTRPVGQAEADVRTYTIPIKRDELASRVEAFRQQLAARDLGFRVPAAKIYQLLLKPAEAQLKGKTNLIIVPDNKLWDLPFQALLPGANRFLIEDAAIAYAPSLTVLREMMMRQKNQNRNAASASLLAMGNPLLGQETINRATLALRDEKLDPLPEAEQEVKALRRLYGTSRSKVYIGSEAREDRVKIEAGQATILHFATHGTLNNAAPMYSNLMLAQGDTNEDGLLEAWELLQLNLKAELAVLSACESARGRTSAGEGMIGLTWALFVAGVPTTLVSQWKVESASTRDLMLGFHRQMRAPSAVGKAKVTKAESLRQAALKLLKNPQTNHPFYWAGFVLVGDGR
jgi:CHAT domain-containing protein/tetratricopeptide (TPR) repeat protein